MLDSLPGGFQDLTDDEEEGEIFTSDLQGGGKQCRSEDEYSSSSPVEEGRQGDPEPMDRRFSFSSGSGVPEELERRLSSGSESINLSQDGDSFASEEEAELSKLENSGSSSDPGLEPEEHPEQELDLELEPKLEPEPEPELEPELRRSTCTAAGEAADKIKDLYNQGLANLVLQPK